MGKLAMLPVLTVTLICGSTYSATKEQRVGDADVEFMNHRLDLLEESVRTYVYQQSPKVATLERQVNELMEENASLRRDVDNQRMEIETLHWAMSDIKAHQLTKEEHDLVTSLQWKVYDMQYINEQLLTEACTRSANCTTWTAWSQCSVTCGGGTKVRSRECSHSPNLQSLCGPLQLYGEVPCNQAACAYKKTRTSPLLFQYDCPENFKSYQGYCFRFSGRQDARLVSNMRCEDDGGHLASLDSDEKNKAVFDYLQIVAPHYMTDMNEDFSKREYWDFHDIDQKVNVAVDGVRRHQKMSVVNWRDEEMTYFHWATGQPRRRTNDGSYCVTMNVLTGSWYLKCCDVPFFYVCETDKRA